MLRFRKRCAAPRPTRCERFVAHMSRFGFFYQFPVVLLLLVMLVAVAPLARRRGVLLGALGLDARELLLARRVLVGALGLDARQLLPERRGLLGAPLLGALTARVVPVLLHCKRAQAFLYTLRVYIYFELERIF